MSKKMYMVNALGAKFLKMLNDSTLEEAKERDKQAGLNTPTEELIRVMKMLERDVGVLDLFIEQFGYNTCFDIESVKLTMSNKIRDKNNLSDIQTELLNESLDTTFNFLLALDAIQEVNINVR